MNLDRDQLQNVLRQVALPALAGAAGGGALGAYMSRNPQMGETPAQRRHRILKNALISAGLGGMAGAALPIGLKTLAQPYFGAGGPPGMFDRATDAGLSHLGLLGGAGAGGLGSMMINKHLGNKAVDRVLSVLGPNVNLPQGLQELSSLKNVTNPTQLRQLLDTGDPGHKFVLSALSGVGGDDQLHRLFRSAEILGQAGGKNLGGSDLRRLFGQGLMADPAAAEEHVLAGFKPPTLPENLHGEYLKYLAGEPVARAFEARPLNAVPGLGRGAGRLAEFLSRTVRPEALRSLMPSMRWGLPAAAVGLPLAGAWLGSQMQNKLTGN